MGIDIPKPIDTSGSFSGGADTPRFETGDRPAVDRAAIPLGRIIDMSNREASAEPPFMPKRPEDQPGLSIGDSAPTPTPDEASVDGRGEREYPLDLPPSADMNPVLPPETIDIETSASTEDASPDSTEQTADSRADTTSAETPSSESFLTSAIDALAKEGSYDVSKARPNPDAHRLTLTTSAVGEVVVDDYKATWHKDAPPFETDPNKANRGAELKAAQEGLLHGGDTIVSIKTPGSSYIVFKPSSLNPENQQVSLAVDPSIPRDPRDPTKYANPDQDLILELKPGAMEYIVADPQTDPILREIFSELQKRNSTEADKH